MQLHLSSNPRALYLATDSYDERLGRPSKVLVFRAGSSKSQVVVEFLDRKQADINNMPRLTTRVVKGCLGFIAIDGGRLGPVCIYRRSHS
jgi:synaptojanin